ncbi:hypothetical protein [endosymbiont GvMRE of Glomus versiforme]|uniref:hypothetical protein n=1 Tax=endosymbiont GvMRE of Glomus versiforme TaxID=2039283 RepID=UPI000EC05904|nr:hypothetical protein [endosymbiont GvMRE of Glomus versiforme]RHZ35638.1 hypothetical protein GvMRE_IIg38 [endosymbiont GvMRE of Glomus versiforme]
MTKARNSYTYELVGIIQQKKSKLISNRELYLLTVKLDSHPNVYTVQAFKDKLENQEIWADLTENKFLDQRYTFFCKNYFGKYHLVNWELANIEK